MDADRHPTQLLMACLGDASRFRIVSALLPGPRCVTDLAVEVGLSQSCTTRHLQALERRGVVCGTRAGKRVLYRLCPDRPELETLLAWALPAGSNGDGRPDGPPARRRPRSRNGGPGSGSVGPGERRVPRRTRQLPAHEGDNGPLSAEPSAAESAPAEPALVAPEAAPPARPRLRSRSDLEDFLL